MQVINRCIKKGTKDKKNKCCQRCGEKENCSVHWNVNWCSHSMGRNVEVPQKQSKTKENCIFGYFPKKIRTLKIIFAIYLLPCYL